jgi:hypothetical protein
MRKQSAHAARALVPVRAQINWDAADDRALVRGMLGRNDGAWLAFFGRFDVLLTKRIEATIGHWSRMLQTPEMIERVKGDVQSFLVSNDMEPLRAFHPRHGTPIAVQPQQEKIMTKNVQQQFSEAEADRLLVQAAVTSLCRIMEAQAAIIQSLTAPQPSALPHLIPFALQLLEVFMRRPERAEASMGPTERLVVAQFNAAHAKLAREMEAKRTAARASDAARQATAAKAKTAA